MVQPIDGEAHLSAIRPHRSVSADTSNKKKKQVVKVPSFEELNPYSQVNLPPAAFVNIKKSSKTAALLSWEPIPNLTPTYDSLALTRAMDKLMAQVQQQTTLDLLEQRANNPEYRLETPPTNSPSVAQQHLNKNNKKKKYRVMKTVARLPSWLLNETNGSGRCSLFGGVDKNSQSIAGWLLKRGGWNLAYKRRYMELNGSKMMYYKYKPVDKMGDRLAKEQRKGLAKGYIDLERVHSIQPKSHPSLEIELVTPNRTWLICAENKTDHLNWLDAMCAIISYNAIDPIYKSMLSLQEVPTTLQTDIRINLDLSLTVLQVIQHIFNFYERSVEAETLPLYPYDASQFCLKVTGFRDFMLDHKASISDYCYVRECEIAGKMLQLTLVHEEEIMISLTRSLSLQSARGDRRSGGTSDATSFDSSTASFITNNTSSNCSSAVLQCLQERRERSTSAPHQPCCPSSPSHSVNRSPSLQPQTQPCSLNIPSLQLEDEENYFSSGSVVNPLPFKFLEVVNIDKGLSAFCSSSKGGDVGVVVFLRISLVNNGEICGVSTVGMNNSNIIDTPVLPLKEQDQDHFMIFSTSLSEWKHTSVNVSNLPQTARLLFQLYGVKKQHLSVELQQQQQQQQQASDLTEDYEELASTAVNLFDVDGHLVAGEKFVNLMTNSKLRKKASKNYDFRIGPVPQIVDTTQMILHIEFGVFEKPVKFDWTNLEFSHMFNSQVGQQDINSFLLNQNICLTETATSSLSSYTPSNKSDFMKCGFLEKLGKVHYATKWRPRWFELDQFTRQLRYFEPSKKLKGTINLEGTEIMVAKEFNREFTKFVVNKGTRKTMSTYCFKIKTKNSREYILSAETEELRREWMFAIQYVINSQSTPTAKTSLNTSNVTKNVKKKKKRSIFTTFFNFSVNELTSSSSSSNNNSEVSSEDDERNGVDLNYHSKDRIISSVKTLSTCSSSLSSSDQNQNHAKELLHVLKIDPLYRLNPVEVKTLYDYRHEFKSEPHVLKIFLRYCINWWEKEDVAFGVGILSEWELSPAALIGLLDKEILCCQVRSFAVSRLAQLPISCLHGYILQLTQALKFESYHCSPLSQLLLEKAFESPNQFGFDLFWSLKVESDDPQYKERYGVILNAYLEVCSPRQRAILNLQDELFSADGVFARICNLVKQQKSFGREQMLKVLKKELNILNGMLPDSFQLPIDSRIEVSKIVVSKCNVMGSAKSPLWLVFENAEKGGEQVTVIFKAGDDIRQDCLTLQIIRLMDEMWREEGLDFAMEPYKCVATSRDTGLLQVVKNSVTTAKIHERSGGLFGAYKDECFYDWIKENNPSPDQLSSALDLFQRSCAGYCVATCVLGIGDRHNDNIMISSSGRYFHIDFGHFLGFFKYEFGIEREPTAFVFTKEMAYVFGGRESKEFKKFVQLCCSAYNVVRRNLLDLFTLLHLMVEAKMPELSSRQDLHYLVQILNPAFSNQNAELFFTSEINKSLDNKRKRVDNFAHNLKHRF